MLHLEKSFSSIPLFNFAGLTTRREDLENQGKIWRSSKIKESLENSGKLESFLLKIPLIIRETYMFFHLNSGKKYLRATKIQ